MLYVITTHFNPQQFKSRKRLYFQFANHMEWSGVKLLTVEAAFGDHAFEVTSPDDPYDIQVRTDQILWHKERLGNLGIQRLRQIAPDARYVGFFDSDITFVNPDWAEQSVHQLKKHPVIQPFSQAINLDSNEEYMWHCPSSFASFVRERGYHQEPPLPVSYTYKGHPGLAWCFTMDALRALGGLYDVMVAGSGDTVMSNCLKGDWSAYLPVEPDINSGFVRSIKQWSHRCDQHVQSNVGFTKGLCLHHWHGKSEERGYEKRWSILVFHGFDPLEDLMVDTNGLYRWSGNKPRLEQDIKLSLSLRNEDAA